MLSEIEKEKNPQLLSTDMQKSKDFFFVESNKTFRGIKMPVFITAGKTNEAKAPTARGKTD